MGVGMTFMFQSTEYKTQDFDDLTNAKELKKFIKINKFNLILTENQRLIITLDMLVWC